MIRIVAFAEKVILINIIFLVGIYKLNHKRNISRKMLISSAIQIYKDDFFHL